MAVVKIGEDTPLALGSGYAYRYTEPTPFLDSAAASFTLLPQSKILDTVEQNFYANFGEQDPNYDVWKDLTGYEGYANSFIGVENKDEADAIKRSIDKYVDARQKQTFTSELLAGVFHPVNAALLPVAGEMLTARGAVLASMAKNAAYGTAVMGTNEAVDLYLDPTKTTEEAVTNTAMVGILSAALGGYLARDTKYVGKLAANYADQIHGRGTLSAAAAPETTLEQQTLKSALGVEKLFKFQDPVLRTLHRSSVVARRMGEAIAETPLIRNKNTEGIASEIAIDNLARQSESYIGAFYEKAGEIFKEYRGFSGPASLAVTRAGITDTVSSVGARVLGKVRPDGKMTWPEFSSETVRALRNGDVHENPYVQRAAEAFRKEVIDPVLKNAVDSGLFDTLDMPVKTAKSYVPRLFDPHKILGDLPRWREINRSWLIQKRDAAIVERDTLLGELDGLKKQIKAQKASIKSTYHAEADRAVNDTLDRIIARFDSAEFGDYTSALKREFSDFAVRAEQKIKRALPDGVKAQISEMQANLERSLKEFEVKNGEKLRAAWHASFEDAEIDSVVDTLTDRILGLPIGRIDYSPKVANTGKNPGVIGRRGAAKTRVYDIPDSLVQDFTIDDLDILASTYTRSLVPDSEIFRKFGTLDYETIFKPVIEDYNKLVYAAEKAGDKTGVRNFQLEKEAALSDLKGMLDRIRGTYSIPTTEAGKKWRAIEHTALNYNYSRLMGGVTLSSIPDPAMFVSVHGLSNTFGPLIRGFSTGFNGIKLGMREGKIAGLGWEVFTNTRSRQWAGLDEYVTTGNKIENAMSNLSSKMTLLSMISSWNSVMKGYAATLTQNYMLNAALKFEKGTVSPKEIERLAEGFIDKQMALRIADQFSKYGKEVDGLRLANLAEWDDAGASVAFRAALRREVDATILTPGQDKPFWLSNTGMKLIGQFKSFAFAATQRILLSGLQRRDMARLNGLLLGVALGYSSYASKQALAGREVKTDLGTIIKEGLDRSGALAWLFDANNIVEKWTGGTVGVGRLMGGQPASRYASRSAMEALFGPTYGGLGNFLSATNSVWRGDVKRSDISEFRKLTPFNNLFYVRGFFDSVEEALGDQINLPPKPGTKH